MPLSPSPTLHVGPAPITVRSDGRDQGAELPSPQETSTEQDKIRGWEDVREAVLLAWEDRRGHLLTSWLHVPFGCLFILVVCWSLDLLVSTIPGLSFPGPVVGCLLTFGVLLLLDWLSTQFPGTPKDVDVEAKSAATKVTALATERRFVKPVMAFIGPPADFLLRNMNLLFTPAFVSIPAREVLPGREVGIIAGYFTLTQIAGFVIPTLVCKLIGAAERGWDVRRGRRSTQDTDAAQDLNMQASKDEEKLPADPHEGRSFGVVAHGVRSITRLSVAPISIDMSHKTNKEIMADQARRQHVDHVQREQARQQGVMTVDADYTNLQHLRHLHQLHQQRPHSSRRGPLLHTRSAAILPNSRRQDGSPRRPVTAEDAQLSSPSDQTSQMQQSGPSPLFDPKFSLQRKATWHAGTRAPSPLIASSFDEIGPDEDVTASTAAQWRTGPHVTRDVMEVVRTAVKPAGDSTDLDPDTLPRLVIDCGESRPSGLTFVNEESRDGVSPLKDDAEDDKDTPPSPQGRRRSRRGSALSTNPMGEPDAIDRLADRLTTYFTPAVYTMIFLIGLPLFFALDFSLPLFLSVNVLTFWVAITIVPPKVRRFLHPILTTSVMTLLILWALGAIKGLSLKETILGHYNVNAKYDKLFSPSGYHGPVPGAADVLSSLLDAGILALSVVLYRYRRDLAECGVRLVLGLVPSVIFTLIVCPAIASLITLDEARSLAFAGRFLSTPLAIELVTTLQGDVDICVILVVVTGIVAALLKEPFFRFMGVDMDDHLTVGLAMGSTAGAIGASSLIARPRVMAVASLSFILFGTLSLLLVAIPPITTLIRQLATIGY